MPCHLKHLMAVNGISKIIVIYGYNNYAFIVRVACLALLD